MSSASSGSVVPLFGKNKSDLRPLAMFLIVKRNMRRWVSSACHFLGDHSITALSIGSRCDDKPL